MAPPVLTPIPNPVVFPREEARRILRIASQVGVAGLGVLLDQVRRMPEDRQYAIRTSAIWGQTATKHVVQSGDQLNQAVEQLQFYWEGDAHAAFRDFNVRLRTATGQVPPLFGQIAALIRKSLTHIIEQYNALAELIASFAGSMLGSVAHFIDMLDADNILSVVPGLIGELRSFGDTVWERIKSAVETVIALWQDTAGIKDISSQFPHLDPVAPEVGDPKWWQVSRPPV